MARGLPAVWSAIFGAPFVLGGAYVYIEDPSPTVPPQVGLPIIGFGLFIVILGPAAIQFLATRGG
jgi:hypothetical protein